MFIVQKATGRKHNGLKNKSLTEWSVWKERQSEINKLALFIDGQRPL